MPAAHRRRTSDSRHRWVIGTAVFAAVALAASITTFVVTRATPSPAAATSTGLPAQLSVVSTNPAPGATGVASDAAISVEFTEPLAANSPMPSLVPSVPGNWVQTSPDTLAFDATVPLPPGATLSVSVPGGDAGVVDTGGQHIAQSVTTQFTVAPMSMLRVQQLLATLGYLPVAFTPSNAAPVAPQEEATAQLGSFSWRWTTMPGYFMALWSPGEPNVVTQGAIMAFESQQNMATDGVAGPKVWEALLQAAAANQADSYGHYDWVDVSEAEPEHVTVWRDGAIVYQTLANTGISVAPTVQGTWPVYAHYVTTTMSGTNPDGSHYSDPGVPWVSYFHGGDALHGFYRPYYGVPQSLGCVEMTPASAKIVFPYTPLGTLVTVE
jgi:peptidoglycan hydrolase-like protein with peptidoglycan-binding domain